MKKSITILLAAVLMLSMSACGGGNNINTPTGGNDTPTTTPEITAMTKEEMLEQAQEINPVDVYNAYQENKARAEAMYLNNVYKISGKVGSIDSDFLTIANFQVYLSGDVLIALLPSDNITVVGEISNMNKKGGEILIHGLGTVTTDVFEMENAYFIEIFATGYVISIIEESYLHLLTIQDISTGNIISIELNSNALLSNIEKNDIVTVKGELNTNAPYRAIVNAELVQ